MPTQADASAGGFYHTTVGAPATASRGHKQHQAPSLLEGVEVEGTCREPMGGTCTKPMAAPAASLLHMQKGHRFSQGDFSWRLLQGWQHLHSSAGAESAPARRTVSIQAGWLEDSHAPSRLQLAVVLLLRHVHVL